MIRYTQVEEVRTKLEHTQLGSQVEVTGLNFVSKQNKEVLGNRILGQI